MVLVKMLMEIDPLPMRGSMVMTMVMISPSRRDVSPAEQLRRSPRLVPPRDGGASSRKLSTIFSRAKDTLYQKMGIGGLPGGPRGRGTPRGVGRTLHPHGQWVAPLWCFLRPIFSIYSKTDFRGVSGLLELGTMSIIFASFPAQNSSCRHSPSSCQPCKIREKRHKYCDIMCNNSP